MILYFVILFLLGEITQNIAIKITSNLLPIIMKHVG